MRSLIAYILLFFISNCFSQQIGDVIVQGNKKTKEDFIYKVANIKRGAVVDSSKIEIAIIQLKRLPGIAHAKYRLEKQEDATYILFFDIEENFTIIPSANLYTTNNGELAYRLGLYEFNGFGKNIMFGGFYQKDIYNSFGLSLKVPYLLGTKIGAAFNFQNLSSEEPVFFDNTTASYKYNNISYEVLGIYRLNYVNEFALGVNFFTEQYDYKTGATSVEVPQNLKVDKLLFKLLYDYDTITYFFQYLDGFKSSLNLQYVTSSNDVLPDFLIGYNDFVYFKKIGNRGNWASRLRLGLATNNDSPFAPFAVDNNLNIRGVGNTIDRGTAAIVMNTEYRHTIYEKGWFVLQSNVFLDAGSWRNPGGDFGDFSKKENFRVYPGVGLRFMHKRIFNAVFRIDYGYGITENATNGFVFGIRQYF